VALRAIEEVSARLAGFRLCIYSATPEVAERARNLSRRTGLPVEIFTARDRLTHEEILTRHGMARISIGAAVTDGVSTSFLEALVMGSFPVQSWTACANEWITDGETGILIPPEDSEEIARAISRAISDDVLVDEAARRNWVTAQERLDGARLAHVARQMYETLVAPG
jgi:glycosyltransferase involved in cell wall biosynthesis